jgi:hypothetical protein
VEVYRTTSINDGVPTFAPSPETYFVGTAPASVTVADINGDGIPDMLVADQGSNDVTVIFGSDNANGDWVGTLGPRLKSGGDGPIAVIVGDLTGNLIPDLAVVNGGSGTVTLLPGVGDGFFNDQDPKVLFNLGSAVIQPPTFIGNSGLGYTVTAGGNLVRFDLDNPSAGASVVFSGQQVVAAQALTSGQVVVALGSGIVDLLGPQGNGLGVESQLLAEGTTPSLPSSIDVVAKANGLFDVLVSSEGSDNLSVFSFGGAVSAGEITPSAGGVSLPSLNAFQPPAVPSSQLVVLTAGTTAASASAIGTSTSSSASTSSGALSTTGATSVGLSLGGFSALKGGSSTGTGEALLVSVEGNTYLSVPILGFGSDNDEVGNGEGRMPWLSAEHSFGDTSPLTRFVMGLDEALRDYRGSEESPLPRNLGSSRDPWYEDLFYRHPAAQPRVPVLEEDDTRESTDNHAMRPGPRLVDREAQPRLAEKPFDEPGVPSSSPAAWIVAGLKTVAGLLATLLLTPTIARYVSREDGHADFPIPLTAKRDDL